MRNDLMLISSGYDQQVKFWSNFNDNKPKNSMDFKEQAINALELLPNREELAIAVLNSVKFIDLVSMSNTPVYSVDSHTANISCLLFHKDLDNLFFSGGEDSTVKLNDKRILKSVKDFDHYNYVNSIQLGYSVIFLYRMNWFLQTKTVL